MVGKTTPVPVATAFVSDTLASSLGQKISTGLIETAIHPQVPQVLGSLTGFIPLPTEPAAAKKVVNNNKMWLGWLGPHRNERVAMLPSTQAATPFVSWEFPLLHAGLGGIAAKRNDVVFGCRDQNDFQDVFTFLDADTGKLL